MPEYKLYYFPLRCRGEPCRLLFEYKGVKYDDIRVSPENWPSLKPNMPMGQMPVLDVDGKMLCQSTAIGRYLAKEFGLAGKNAWDAAKADMYADGVYDMWGCIRSVYMPLMQGDRQAMEANWSKFKIDYLNTFLQRYNDFLVGNKSGWLVGDDLTWADFVLSDFLSICQDCFSAECLAGYPALKKYVENVQNLPQLKHYIATRPKSTF